MKPLEFELGMQGLHAFYYTKGFGNFNQEMNNTLQSALSGSTETYTIIQFKKKYHFQYHFAEKKSKFGAKRKWNTLIWLKTLLQLNNVVLFSLG